MTTCKGDWTSDDGMCGICADSPSVHQITEAQILRLREEALGAGDYLMADICDRALTRDADTIGEPFRSRARSRTARIAAFAECARVIAAAAAQE